MSKLNIADAILDINQGLRRIHLATTFGWLDVKQRYRRSVVGPFWLTVSMGVMIGTIGIVFSQIFKSPTEEYMPFLAIGMIIWAYFIATLTEGTFAFIHAEGIIKQIQIPFFTHVLRIIWRNLVILAHNMVIIPIVFLATGKSITFVSLYSIIGIALMTANIAWIILLLGILCARFRDLPQIIASVTQVLFYFTPIIWMPNLIPARTSLYLLTLNPLHHLFEIVRAPMLGNFPTIENWVVATILAIIGWSFTIVVFGKLKNRIAFWI